MRKTSLAEAVFKIRDGQRVLVPPACGLPMAFAQELAEQAARFRDLTILGGILIPKAPFVSEEFKGNFRFVSCHTGGFVREALARKQASYVPLRYFDTIAAFSPGGPLAADVVVVHVAPSDSKGRYSLGVSVSYPLPVARKAPLVIAQLNPQMPRTLGNSFLSEDEIDILVEADEPVVAYEASRAGKVEEQIARHVAGLVPDGATLQTGIGAVPEALLGFLKDKKDLRLYSLLVDSALELYEAGSVRKGPEGSRICEIMGSQKLFRFVHENPDVFMEDSSVIHDPRKICRIPRFVSVLSALEVDLTGQVAAESLGPKMVAGVGGQLDFAIGTSLAEDSVCIVALPSRGGRDGDQSRIVEKLQGGAAVTTSRSLVRFVASEYGVADLWGKDLDQRARALTKIAAPEFRESLEKAWQERGRT